MNVVQFLAKEGLTVSMSNGRRLVFQNAVKVNGVLETDICRELVDGDVVEFRKKELVFKEDEPV